MIKKITCFFKYILLILIFSGQNNLLFCDFLTELPAPTSPQAVGSEPSSIAYSANGKFAAITNKQKSTISVFTVNSSTGAFTKVTGSPFTTKAISPNSIQFLPTTNSNFAAVAGNTGIIEIFSVSSTGVFTSLQETTTTAAALSSIAYSPNGKFLAVTNTTQILAYLVDSSGTITAAGSGVTPSGGGQPIASAYSPNDSYLAVANKTADKISIFSVNQTSGAITELTTGSPFDLPTGGTGPSSIAYSPNGNFLATANTSNNVSMFKANSTSGQLTEIGNTSSGTSASGTIALAFAPNSEHLVVANSGSDDVSAFKVDSSSGSLEEENGSPIALRSGETAPDSIAYYPENDFVATANNATSNVTIFRACNLSVSISQNPTTNICPGTEVTLTANVTGSTGTINYTWSDGQTGSPIIVKPETDTTYTVTVTDSNGCSEVASIDINIDTVTVEISTSPTTPEICSGNFITLTANTTPSTGNFSYEWTTANSAIIIGSTKSITVNPTEETSYTVKAKNLTTGCEGQSSPVTVTVQQPPQLSIESYPEEHKVCKNGSVKLTASSTTSGTTFFWNTNPIQRTASIYVTKPGDYLVTATNPANKCSISKNFTVQPGTGTSPTVTISCDPSSKTCGSVCQGSDLTLTANASDGSGDYIYLWQYPDGSTKDTQSIKFEKAESNINGTYTVIVVDNETQCGSMPASVKISVNLKPNATIQSFPSTPTICQDGSVMLVAEVPNGTSTYSYEWSTGETTQGIFVEEPDTYDVVITDTNTGCESDKISIIVKKHEDKDEAPVVKIVTEPLGWSVTEGCSISLTGEPSAGSGTYISFNWLLPDGSTFIGRTIDIKSADSSDAGEYQLMVVDSNGCGSKPESIEITVEPFTGKTSNIESSIKEKYEIACRLDKLLNNKKKR